MSEKGIIFIVSGPAGAGKGTVVKEVVKKDGIELSISATTRKPRGKEQDGIEYHFMTREQFSSMIDDDGFFEYAEYCGNFYGSPKKPVVDWVNQGKDVILEIEVQGCEKVKKILPDSVSIFVVPPSMEILEKRLRGRNTETEEVIKKRMERAVEELKKSSEYDYVVVNDEIENCANEILSIIEKEKLRVQSSANK